MSERVVRAARKLVACVQRERDLKAQIDWSACENGDQNEFDERGELTYVGHPPCPFVEDPGNDDPDYFGRVRENADEPNWGNGRLPSTAWCEPCRRNWQLRGEWAAERRRRPSFIRSLENAVKALPPESTAGVTPNG